MNVLHHQRNIKRRIEENLCFDSGFGGVFMRCGCDGVLAGYGRKKQRLSARRILGLILDGAGQREESVETVPEGEKVRLFEETCETCALGC